MRSRDAAFIRKLCSLGLPPRSLALAVLPAMRQIVPAHSGGVFWVDDDGQMSSLYAERMLPPDAMMAYHERHYDRRADGFAAAFRARAARDDPVSAHAFSKAEQATPYFRDVLQPLDAYHVLYAVLRSHGRAFAQLSLYRGARDAPFDGDDAAALRSLVRYLASGLEAPATAPQDGGESTVAEEALGIVTSAGEIVSASDDWKRLVRLGALPDVTPSHAAQERAAVEAFLRDLSDAAQARAVGKTRELVRNTAWGRFVVRPFELEDAQGRRRKQVALLIRREEPRTVSLVRGAGNSALSPQQREVALLLAQGKTNTEVAALLGLALNTANYHVKQVYARLQVNDRAAVAGQLLKLAQASAAA